MTFEKITNDTGCDCLNGTVQDTVSVFARVLRKDSTTEKDFLSHWEREQRAEDCEKACKLKGISISKVENETVKNEIVTIYSQMFKLSPKYKRGVLIFKFINDAGLVKPTPDSQNKYHHDFYKSDDFSLLFISSSETITLLPTSV